MHGVPGFALCATYPYGLREEHPDEVLHAARQRQELHVGGLLQCPVNPESGKQLQGGHL